MRLLRFIARTRRRLAISGSACLVAAVAGSPFLADYIRTQSTSVNLDLGLMSAWLFFVLLAAILLAILAADLIFPWHWRRRMILGEIIPPPKDWEGSEALRATQSHIIPFSVIVVVLIFGGGLMLEGVTQGFFDEYQRMGHIRTLMRTDQTATKLELIKERAKVIPSKRPVADALALLERIWADTNQPLEVRVAALEAIGKIAQMLLRSLDSWADRGVQVSGRWEQRAIQQLRKRIVGPLRRNAAESPAAMKAKAVWVLGKIRDRDSITNLQATVSTAKPTSEDWVIAVHALGSMHGFESLEPLLAVFERTRDAKALVQLGWAIAEISKNYPAPATRKAPPAIFLRLIKDMGELLVDKTRPVSHRCTAAYVLRYIGDTEVSERLFKGWAAAKPDEMCQEFELTIPGATTLTLGSKNTLMTQILHGFRFIGRRNTTVIAWSKRQMGRQGLSDEHRHHLATLCGTASSKEETCKGGCFAVAASSMDIRTSAPDLNWVLEGPDGRKGVGPAHIPWIRAGTYTITWPNRAVASKLKPGKKVPRLEQEWQVMPGTLVRFTLKDNLGETSEKKMAGGIIWHGFCLNPQNGIDAEKTCQKVVQEQVKDTTQTGTTPSVDRLATPQKPPELTWLQSIMANYGALSWWGGLKAAGQEMQKGCRFTTPQGTAIEKSCETPRAFVCGWSTPR